MRVCDVFDVGASLFVPADHKNLPKILLAQRYTQLQSVVIDFEDGLEESSLEGSFQHLKSLLATITHATPFVFLRPRNSEMLKKMLQLPNIEKCDGFVLPKFSLENALSYTQPLCDTPFMWMPSIEGEELFEPQKLQHLKNILLPYKKQIVCIRFGLEDMLKRLSMKRSCQKSVFDYAVTQSVLGNFLAVFKSEGFMVSGGVFPCFLDDDGFVCDVQRDLDEGLFGKTIIHPRQISLANELYKVDEKSYQEALEMVQSTRKVFNQNGSMAESITMRPYAKTILRRYEVYGVASNGESCSL